MKFNQWTLGLAAVGVISLASAAQAEEGAVPLMTALSATTISGYVDTSAQWNLGTGTGTRYNSFSAGKDDGFNLNVVQLSIAKALDESDWAAGYKVDLWMGPDASALATDSNVSRRGQPEDFAIRQAYVALRAPVGNGLDFKVGVFDTIIGYESLESGNNPNYTRSYGFTIEPQTHTGVLATYRFCDVLSASAGVANTVGPQINERGFTTDPTVGDDVSESYKTYMGSVALTAPENWGFLAGSTLYAGVVNGYNSADGDQTSWYVGSTINTPLTGLKVGAAWDVLDSHRDSASGASGEDAWAAAAYASYQATEKLSFHARGELITFCDNTFDGDDNGVADYPGKDDMQVWALTGTVQYDLWENVISRLEVRWDLADEGDYFTDDSSDNRTKDAVMVAANFIYKF